MKILESTLLLLTLYWTDAIFVSSGLFATCTIYCQKVWFEKSNTSKVQTGTATHTETLVTTLRCLSQAPRLPSLDWGAIIRRCMRYEDQVAELLPPSSALRKGIVREECLKFSLAHANQFDQLLIFLDELSDISRFRTLGLNLQSCLLTHLAGLMKVFSNARVEKLFNDMKIYMSSFYLDQLLYNYEKHLLCIACWKGLYQCIDEANLNSLECIAHIEDFMVVLFTMLPTLSSSTNKEVDEVQSAKEWSEAIRCLSKARQTWLLNFLQVHSTSLYWLDFFHCVHWRGLIFIFMWQLVVYAGKSFAERSFVSDLEVSCADFMRGSSTKRSEVIWSSKKDESQSQSNKEWFSPNERTRKNENPDAELEITRFFFEQILGTKL